MKRQIILNKLINYEEPIEVLQKNLKGISWDCDTDLVLLETKHLKQMFSLFTAGKIRESILEEWANLIEGREDIGFENDDIKNIVFELANPILYGDINLGKVENYYNALRGGELILK